MIVGALAVGEDGGGAVGGRHRRVRRQHPGSPRPAPPTPGLRRGGPPPPRRTRGPQPGAGRCRRRPAPRPTGAPGGGWRAPGRGDAAQSTRSGPVSTAAACSAHGEAPAGVAPPDLVAFARRRQSLQPELPDRVEHLVARLLVDAAHLGQQALVDERGDAVEDRRRDGVTERRTSRRIVSVLSVCPSARLPAATASAASSVKPPAKTARRRKRACSSGVRRS